MKLILKVFLYAGLFFIFADFAAAVSQNVTGEGRDAVVANFSNVACLLLIASVILAAAERRRARRRMDAPTRISASRVLFYAALLLIVGEYLARHLSAPTMPWLFETVGNVQVLGSLTDIGAPLIIIYLVGASVYGLLRMRRHPQADEASVRAEA